MTTKTKRKTTVYPKSVKPIREYTNAVLKPGKNNAKLGGKITKGPWKGSTIYSLTLTERSTCPKSCHHWDDCYGNNMPFAHRIQHGPALEKKIEAELTNLLKKKPEGITVRLHVLGDFYSLRYIKFWERMLIEHPKLTIFGYTAHPEDSYLGKGMLILNLRYSERCVIRYSRSKESNGIGQLYAAEESFEGVSFDCPEQTGKVASCADCGLCWKADKTVKFRSH